MSLGTLGIVELAAVCARMRAQSLDLFRELGTWVGLTDGEHQRWYATACHRHAWHADLWAQRCPAIPTVALGAAVADASRPRLPDLPDAAAYRVLLDTMRTELDELSSRIDNDLDPSTQRVIALVVTDLVDLHHH